MKIIQMVKRWNRNIRWLLNRPPTTFKASETHFPCDYCGSNGWIDIEGNLAVCTECLKKALDKALRG